MLCDTNGGTLPHDVERIVAEVVADFECQVGVHFHNDSGCAVANSIAGVRAGATHVQGCVNGYGERTGNADLSAAIPNLSLKLNVRTIPADRLERITPVSHHIAELVNIAPNPQQPYVGAAAFAHKAGLHTSAIARRRDAYEHIPPDSVGNGTRFVVSEMAGRSTLALKAQELGLELDSDALSGVLDTLKALEYRGYHFEVADGSLELLLRKATGWDQTFFEVESFRVINDHTDRADGIDRAGRHTTEATVKIRVGDERVVATAEGNGPINALDSALRQAIGGHFPNLSAVHLVDYRVRVLDTGRGTGAVTRVLIDSSDGEHVWTTIGVSENIIEASWQALFDSIVYGLRPRRAGARTPGTPTGRPGAPEPQMTQPNFVPIVETDQVRPSYRLRTPADWRAGRVADLRGPEQTRGRELGVPGPDQGYALLLAHTQFEDRLELSGGITAEDALVGCAAVASRRAALFGRAPVAKDIELALVLFGFLGGARRPRGVAGPVVPGRRAPLPPAADHRRCGLRGDPADDPGRRPQPAVGVAAMVSVPTPTS